MLYPFLFPVREFILECEAICDFASLTPAALTTVDTWPMFGSITFFSLEYVIENRDRAIQMVLCYWYW